MRDYFLFLQPDIDVDYETSNTGSTLYVSLLVNSIKNGGR
jgi:hypothetical protein